MVALVLPPGASPACSTAAVGSQQPPAASRFAVSGHPSDPVHCARLLRSEAAADSVLTLLFAGHDTSATSLTRILWHLHSHPEAEARLREEQVRVKGVLKRCERCCPPSDLPAVPGVLR